MEYPLTDQLEKLTKMLHEPPATVIAQAVKIGLSKLYLDAVLQQYLKKKISRAKAIQLAGLDAVKLAEQQHHAVQKDIAWGLGHG